MKKIQAYLKRVQFEFEQWRWRRYFHKCNSVYQHWETNWKSSDAEVILGPHFLKDGGVRNHILAIKKYSKRRVKLVPGEIDLEKYGSAPFIENASRFLSLPPPASAIAVHTHVFPWLIEWADLYADSKLRWIHTHHCLYYPCSPDAPLEKWQTDLNESMLGAARKSHICLCVSQWQREVLKTTYQIDSTFLPNGVDVPLCDRANASNFRRRWKIDTPFALWIGRFDNIKNPLDFVRLAIESPTQNFVMIGGVTAEILKCDFNILPPKNLLLLPAARHQDVLDAIAACQALVVTSFREGLPTIVLEAMAMEKQIIVPNESGCLDATDGDSNASIYSHGNISELQEKLYKSMSNKTPVCSARRRVLSEFDWQIVAAKLDRIYTGGAP